MMTWIRYFLENSRGRRNQRLSTTDLVFAETFSSETYKPINKESSFAKELTSQFLKQAHQEKHRHSDDDHRYPASTFSLIFIFTLTGLFLLLPLAYLLHCFGLIYVQEHFIDHNLHLYENNPSVSLPPPPKPDYGKCTIIGEIDRFDCFPENNANKEGCESRGCCWIPARDQREQTPLDVPYCFYPSNFNTYNYVNITKTSFGLVAFLKRDYSTPYPRDVDVIKMIVKYETESRLHVKIIDPTRSRFETPYPEVPVADEAAANLTYYFSFDANSDGFTVVRKADGTTVFDATQGRNLIFSDQFLQLSAKLPTSNIYGLGEHRNSLLLSTNWTLQTLFNHDNIPRFKSNGYGSHPFYLLMEDSGNSHGVFLLNSNSMDVLLQPTPAITFRSIGGVLDFYFFLGPTPSDVISQYTELVGRPHMPPYWGLGFHLCRFGYKTLNETKLVMQRNIDAGIPLDTQWNDLDYMNDSNDFSYDKVNFEGLPSFVKDLHERGMHYIPLIDPGISGSEKPGSYFPYDEGIRMNIFVKNSSNQVFIGKVWNRGSTVWPDFTNPNAVNYWTSMLRSFHDLVEFDGAWIDMNEPSNFFSGQADGCPKSELESPPYLPEVDGGVLNFKTLCMTARHYAGLHYNVHNLYGLTEAIVTNFAMSEIRDKRPVIISRSSFPGLGRFAGHWSGDVGSDWVSMKYSIPQLLNFNLFGIPLMGADICGFNQNTTEALCNRWMQLGAFYPFSRNHNTDDGIDQDPVALGPRVVASAKKALTVRYSLLPYLYTLFWKAHVEGKTVARPLFFEFPTDRGTYGIDTQFLWGPGLMIVPVLEESTVRTINVTGYFPKAIWYDFYSDFEIHSNGENVNISAAYDTIPLFVRGGYILPQQLPAQTTTKSRLNNIRLLAAFDENREASGEMYWDDGDSLNSYEEKRYSLFNFSLNNSALRISCVFWGSENPPNLGGVTIVGMRTFVSSAYVNGELVVYRDSKTILELDRLNVSLKNEIEITWKYSHL